MNEHLRETPSECGEISFEIGRAPVSLQSKSAKRREFKKFVSSIVKEAGFLLSGDVKIIVEWKVTEQHRYEHPSAYDVDNIIKPLLDSISGPNGFLVDDNQVQSIECYWTDVYQDTDEKLIVTVKYVSDEWLRKDGLEFVAFDNNLCLPIWSNSEIEHQKIVIDSYKAGLELRAKAMQDGIEYMHAKLAMSIQRVFHKGRLGGFRVSPVEEWAAKIDNSIKAKNSGRRDGRDSEQ